MVVDYARKLGPGRPILIGDVCLHLGWWASLTLAETALEDLVVEGMLVRLPQAECDRRGLQHAYILAV